MGLLTRLAPATVTTMAWKRTIALEHQKWVPKQSTKAPPAGARNVRKERRPVSAPVASPQQPQQPGLPAGSGIPGPTVAGIRTEVLPLTFYSYEVVEWVPGRSLTASGTGPDDVHWPDEPPGPGEREKSRTETYSAVFYSDGRPYETDLPESQWRQLRPGAVCQLSFRLLGGGIRAVIPGQG